MVMMNGRLYDGKTLAEIGATEAPGAAVLVGDEQRSFLHVQEPFTATRRARRRIGILRRLRRRAYPSCLWKRNLLTSACSPPSGESF